MTMDIPVHTATHLKWSACLLALAAAPAQALEWGASLGADARWFDWREYVGSQQAVMETGPLAAPVLGLEVGSESWFADVSSLWGGGLARYDGHLQGVAGAPVGQPYEADAWEEIIETEWRVGLRSERGRVHVGLLQRDWRRYIEGDAGVSSAEERYRWRLATLGGEVTFLGSPEWRLALTLGVPVESRQTVYSAKYDDFRLEPGDGFYWRIAFPWRPVAGDTRLSLEPYFQQQQIESSEAVALTSGGVPTGEAAYQPASIRRELGLTLRWRLGGGRDEAASP